MDYIEFDAHPGRGGILAVPEEYREEIEKANLVHVTISKINGSSRLKKGVIRQMIENPIVIPGFKPPTREENYEGR